MTKKHLPNIVTLTRLLLLPVIWHFISQKTVTGTTLAIIFIAVLGGTDLLDGYLARKLDAKSHIGRILDPAVDKTCASVIMISLILYRNLPLWYALAVIVRNVFMLAGGLLLMLKRHVLVESNVLGKLSMAVTIIVMAVFLLQIQPLQRPAVYVSLCLIVLSTANYILINIKGESALKPITKKRKYRFDMENYLKSLFE